MSDIWAMQQVQTSSKAERARRGYPLVPKSYRVTKGDPDPAHRAAFLDEAQQLASAGYTDFELAEALGMTVPTFHLRRQRDPEFRAAVQMSKDIADARVEATLYQKATGYTFRSEEIKVIDSQVVRVPTVTHVAPDTASMIFWLKNRKREEWRDQQDMNVTGTIETKTDLRELALAMLATIKAGLMTPPTIIDAVANATDDSGAGES